MKTFVGGYIELYWPCGQRSACWSSSNKATSERLFPRASPRRLGTHPGSPPPHTLYLTKRRVGPALLLPSFLLAWQALSLIYNFAFTIPESHNEMFKTSRKKIQHPWSENYSTSCSFNTTPDRGVGILLCQQATV
jgi:hypothetical protein